MQAIGTSEYHDTTVDNASSAVNNANGTASKAGDTVDKISNTGADNSPSEAPVPQKADAGPGMGHEKGSYPSMHTGSTSPNQSSNLKLRRVASPHFGLASHAKPGGSDTHSSKGEVAQEYRQKEDEDVWKTYSQASATLSTNVTQQNADTSYYISDGDHPYCSDKDTAVVVSPEIRQESPRPQVSASTRARIKEVCSIFEPTPNPASRIRNLRMKFEGPGSGNEPGSAIGRRLTASKPKKLFPAHLGSHLPQVTGGGAHGNHHASSMRYASAGLCREYRSSESLPRYTPAKEPAHLSQDGATKTLSHDNKSLFSKIRSMFESPKPELHENARANNAAPPYHRPSNGLYFGPVKAQVIARANSPLPISSQYTFITVLP